ncbi:peptidase M4 family protein, partial [Streptomyces sp. SID486]|nr:peptidase M4 family protein [Streptomyces sp. SID486]
RHKRTTLAIATAVAAGALVSTGLTTSASAQIAAAPGSAKPLAAAPATLSAATRTTLVHQAQQGAAATARRIGLGAKEKLVVKDVVKD